MGESSYEVLRITSVRPLVLSFSFPPASGQLLRGAEPPGQPSGKAQEVSYYREVRRIFQQNCQGCHQPAKSMGGFVMTSHAALLDKGESGEPGIVPGKPELSKIFAQITP